MANDLYEIAPGALGFVLRLQADAALRASYAVDPTGTLTRNGFSMEEAKQIVGTDASQHYGNRIDGIVNQ